MNPFQDLKPVGFLDRDELEELQKDGANIPDEMHQKIVRYLKSGVTLTWSPGFSEDLLSPGKIIGSDTTLSDGEWIWPNSLTYYVESYHIGLPQEFLKTMEANGYRVGFLRRLRVIFSNTAQGHRRN